MGLTHILKFLIVIVTVIAFLPFMVNAMSIYKNDSLGGFDTSVEKTAQETVTVITPTPVRKTMDDLALSLLILDEYHPDPQLLRLRWIDETTGAVLNTSEIAIDLDFFQEKSDVIVGAVLGAGNVLSPSHYVEWEYFVDSSNNSRWNINIYD